MKLVEIAGLHMEATTGAPLVLLREQDAPHRVLPIFVGGPEAAAIALALSGQFAPRPSTHDVMAALVESLDAEVERIEVTGLRDGAFLDEAGTVLQVSPDEGTIDDEVSEFRSFLDDVDPADFGSDPVPGPDPDDPSGEPDA